MTLTGGRTLVLGPGPAHEERKEVSPWVGDHIALQRLTFQPLAISLVLSSQTREDGQRQGSSVVRALGWRSGDVDFSQPCDLLQDFG